MRTRTRVQRRELFGAPGVDGFSRRCFSFTFDCEGWKKGFLFFFYIQSRFSVLKEHASPHICAGNECTLTHLPLFSSLFLLFCLFPETFFSHRSGRMLFFIYKKI